MQDIYFHSKELNLDGKLNKETGKVTIKDRSKFYLNSYVTYSKAETDLIPHDMKIDIGTHNIKKWFGGEIVGVNKVFPEIKKEMPIQKELL